MRRLLNFIRRSALLFHIRCLEATLHGQNQALLSTRDADTREDIILARAATRRALDAATAEYISLRRQARQPACGVA